MRLSKLVLFTCVCAWPLHGASEFYKDKGGDLKVEERIFDGFDISSVKVTSADRKTFVFEVKTKAPIEVPANETCYFTVAVNLDGDMATGSSAWTPGQDFCAFIDLEGKEVKKVRLQRGEEAKEIGEAKVEGDTLRFTLTADAAPRKRITFNIRSMVRRQSADGKVPYVVLDSSVPADERYHEFKL